MIRHGGNLYGNFSPFKFVIENVDFLAKIVFTKPGWQPPETPNHEVGRLLPD
jgi:hypothetical protein